MCHNMPFPIVGPLEPTSICNRFRDNRPKHVLTNTVTHMIHEHINERTNRHDGSQYILAEIMIHTCCLCRKGYCCHSRRSSVNFGARHYVYKKLTKFPTFAWYLPEKNARILHDNCSKIGYFSGFGGKGRGGGHVPSLSFLPRLLRLSLLLRIQPFVYKAETCALSLCVLFLAEHYWSRVKTPKTIRVLVEMT